MNLVDFVWSHEKVQELPGVQVGELRGVYSGQTWFRVGHPHTPVIEWHCTNVTEGIRFRDFDQPDGWPVVGHRETILRWLTQRWMGRYQPVGTPLETEYFERNPL